MYVFMCVLYMCVCIYERMYVCIIRVCMYMCTNVYMYYTCVYIYVYEHMYVCMHLKVRRPLPRVS